MITYYKYKNQPHMNSWVLKDIDYKNKTVWMYFKGDKKWHLAEYTHMTSVHDPENLVALTEEEAFLEFL